MFSERWNVEFPADFRTAAEFTGMEKPDGWRIFWPRFQVMGVNTVDLDEFRFDVCHLWSL